MKNMYLRIPDELHARVKSKAVADGISMNHIAVSAIKSYLESIKLHAHFRNDEYDEILIFMNGVEAEKLQGFIQKYQEDQERQWPDTRQQKDG